MGCSGSTNQGTTSAPGKGKTKNAGNELLYKRARSSIADLTELFKQLDPDIITVYDKLGPFLPENLIFKPYEFKKFVKTPNEHYYRG